MPYSFLKIIAKNKIFEKPLQCIEKCQKANSLRLSLLGDKIV